MTATTPSPADLRVGDYRLLAKIGEGGMGVVHLARRPDGHRVALKVLRPHIVGDDEARARLAREVASLRRVTSPRVAEVLDADPYAETPYVATRYVPGLSLHQHVRQEGPLTGPDLLHFGTGLVEAVIAVHRVGVLHRDVKPSNVLLEGRSPVLIDFGLARLAEDPRLTHTGWLLGTPGYLAPEILYGDDATTASDVHSWAATVVFAATGRPPFGTGPAMAIMDRVRRGEHDLSGVPAALVPLLRSCLAPDPRDRPETAAILSSLRALAGTPPRLPDETTMPFAVVAAGPPDDDPTDVLGDDAPTAVAATTVAPPPAAAPPAAPVGPPAASRSPHRAARTRRDLLMIGLLALVASGFAAAPYLTLAVTAGAALVVRTVSWTTEAAGERQRLRGRHRWYDGPLAVATAPWYLVVATGGTLVLLVWSAVLTFAVGLAYLLFRAPLLPGMLLMGLVLALSLWWGPGARRLRRPVRMLATTVTRPAWAGWTTLAVVAAGLGLLGFVLATSAVQWYPLAGAPWRAGTLLGDLLRWL